MTATNHYILSTEPSDWWVQWSVKLPFSLLQNQQQAWHFLFPLGQHLRSSQPTWTTVHAKHTWTVGSSDGAIFSHFVSVMETILKHLSSRIFYVSFKSTGFVIDSHTIFSYFQTPPVLRNNNLLPFGLAVIAIAWAEFIHLEALRIEYLHQNLHLWHEPSWDAETVPGAPVPSSEGLCEVF